MYTIKILLSRYCEFMCFYEFCMNLFTTCMKISGRFLNNFLLTPTSTNRNNMKLTHGLGVKYALFSSCKNPLRQMINVNPTQRGDAIFLPSSCRIVLFQKIRGSWPVKDTLIVKKESSVTRSNRKYLLTLRSGNERTEN